LAQEGFLKFLSEGEMGIAQPILESIVTLMALPKTCASILALALILQSGCDFWCQDAEQVTSMNPIKDGGVAPCHHSGSDHSGPKHSGGSPEHKGCVHPQAADDNSKLRAKVTKAERPIAIIDAPQTYRQAFLDHVVPSGALSGPIPQSGPPSTILRI
jgi:hypothetical protein